MRKWPVVMVAAALTIGAAGVASAAEPSGTEGSGTHRFVVSVDAVSDFKYRESGSFATPVGAAEPGPLFPGAAYEWMFHAAPGDRLSFATMLVQSNDWFFAPSEQGIPLYTDGKKMVGDVTAYVALWDAGTEGDEMPGAGANQAPRSAGPNTGPADPMTHVLHVLTDQIPAVDELVRVTLRDAGYQTFALGIDNISSGSDFPTPLPLGSGWSTRQSARSSSMERLTWGWGWKVWPRMAMSPDWQWR